MVQAGLKEPTEHSTQEATATLQNDGAGRDQLLENNCQQQLKE